MQKVKKFLATTALTIATLGLAACDVEQTEEGAMPEVEGGNLPEYDVDTATVDADAGTETVEVPDTIEVPAVDVDVQGPNESDAKANVNE